MVRRAEESRDELISLYRLLEGMHAEAAIFPPINPHKVMQAIHRCFTTGGVWVVGEDEIVGALGLFEDRPWFSDSPHLMDMFFYVKPAARKSRAAIELIRQGMELAKEKEMPLSMAVMNPEDVDLKDAFMRRKGFKKVGGLYVQLRQ